MNTDDRERELDRQLDNLLHAAREEGECTGRVEFGFETRMLARLREERRSSWLAWAWRLCPYAAALALVAGAWSYAHLDDSPESESVYAAVRLAGMPMIDYYLGGDE